MPSQVIPTEDDIGVVFMCSRSGEQKYPAEIVRTRKLGDIREFYVHYVGLDRRLDEWVSQDKLGERATQSDLKLHVPSFSKGTTGRGRKRSLTKSDSTVSKGDSADVPRVTRHGHGHDEHTKVRNINRVQFDGYEIDCWYYSPYPGKYGQCEKLYVCEKTFKYMRKPSTYKRHLEEVKSVNSPPGREIYRDDEKMLSVFEIDGKTNRLYGQNLCLFSKLFIEHKTLSYDPDPFFFYVMVERDEKGFHPVGYFSKEKNSPELYNLACILILPPHQRKGYGKFIISLSYEISKRQNTLGSPEKPLSDLGKLSYRSFWSYVLLDLIHRNTDPSELTLKRMATQTSIKVEDILSTLQHLKMIKHLKGQFVIHVSKTAIKQQLDAFNSRSYAKTFCHPKNLSYSNPTDTVAESGIKD